MEEEVTEDRAIYRSEIEEAGRRYRRLVADYYAAAAHLSDLLDAWCNRGWSLDDAIAVSTLDHDPRRKLF